MPERKTAHGLRYHGLRYTRQVEEDIRTRTRELIHYKGAPDDKKDEFDGLSVNQLHGFLTIWRGNLTLEENLNRFFGRNGYLGNGNDDYIDEAI